MASGADAGAGAGGGGSGAGPSAGAAAVRGAGAIAINASGLFEVTGGILAALGDITVTGGALHRGSGGVFSWAASHNLTIQSGGQAIR